MSDSDLTLDEARRVLGLGSDEPPDRLIGAFRAAVKRVHPDRPDGDAVRFRQVLEAYRLLESQVARSAEPAPAPPESATAAQRRRFAAAWAG